MRWVEKGEPSKQLPRGATGISPTGEPWQTVPHKPQESARLKGVGAGHLYSSSRQLLAKSCSQRLSVPWHFWSAHSSGKVTIEILGRAFLPGLLGLTVLPQTFSGSLAQSGPWDKATGGTWELGGRRQENEEREMLAGAKLTASRGSEGHSSGSR